MLQKKYFDQKKNVLPNAMKNSNINCTVSNVMFAISVPLDP